MGLTEDVGRGPVAVDSSIFIYKIERHPRYLKALRTLFDAFEDGRLVAVTSAISLLEVLVQPLRAGRTDLVETYQAYLNHGPGLRLRPIELDTLRTAAALRATIRVRTPDALQLATALAEGCTAFVTNDRRIPEVPGLKVIQLEEVA